MVAHTLITTADERTWPKEKNHPVVFLGEWCRRYSRKHAWHDMNYKIASYHWDDRDKLYSDYQYLQKLYEKLLEELSCQLNQIHSVEYSQRYWRILIGPWLGYFTQILFDRWYMLSQAIDKDEEVKCNIIDRLPLSTTSNDTEHFLTLVAEDEWNEAIYGQLLERYCSESVTIKNLLPKRQNDKKQVVSQQNWKISLRFILMFFYGFFPNNNKYFFITTYLPLKINLKLQMRLGQFPRLWFKQSVPVVRPIKRERERFLVVKDKVNFESFEDIIRDMIPLHLPTAYLEGFKPLVEKIKKLPWPLTPKLMFTSNSFEHDDIFKTWAAEKAEIGVPFVIGQHGGGFGTMLFGSLEKHQIQIADKWVSWGWSDTSKPQIIPIGNLKAAGRSVSYDPSGNILMAEMSFSRYSTQIYAAPISSQWLDYFDDQKSFLQALPKELYEQVLLRLSPHDCGWDQHARWQDQLPTLKIDTGCIDIQKLMKKCRVYVSTYNSTTYLESLTWNIPTIIFWNMEHWELKDNVKPYFDLLESVGILHKTPESAAQQMIYVWDDVTDWWESKDVQRVRTLFCHEFTRTSSKNLLKDLEQLFCNVMV